MQGEKSTKVPQEMARYQLTKRKEKKFPKKMLNKIQKKLKGLSKVQKMILV